MSDEPEEPRPPAKGRIVFDVETVAPIEEPWFERLSMQAARRAARAFATEDELDEWRGTWGATHTVLARVVAVGMLHKPSGRTRTFVGENEALLLEGVAEALSKVRRIVTFGGHEFDVPLLINRIVRHRISLPQCLAEAQTQKPWFVRPHLDVRVALTGGRRMAHGSLEAFSLTLLGRTPKTEMSGADVADRVLGKPEAEWAPAVARYVMEDVLATSELEDVYLAHVEAHRKERGR